MVTGKSYKFLTLRITVIFLLQKLAKDFQCSEVFDMTVTPLPMATPLSPETQACTIQFTDQVLEN